MTEEVNKTEYIVLEMTPVVSIDSTAVHAIQDVVNDLRGRGIQTAFAMVGNRVEKTMDRAKLKDLPPLSILNVARMRSPCVLEV